MVIQHFGKFHLVVKNTVTSFIYILVLWLMNQCPQIEILESEVKEDVTKAPESVKEATKEPRKRV